MAEVALTGAPVTRFTRSHALLAVGAGAAALLIPRLPLLATDRGSGLPYERAVWTPTIGNVVGLEAVDGQKFTATVAAVSDLTGRPAGDPGAFSLLFEAPGDSRHAGVTRVTHPRLGDVPMIAFPVGRPGSRQLYEAVVNTSRSPGGHHG
jgi:hypothetical protein